MVSEYLIRAQKIAISKRLALRWMSLLAILALELVVLTARYKAPELQPLLTNDISWSAWLFNFSKEIWPAGLWIIGACLVILSPRFKIILSALREQSIEYHWLVWLGFHLLAFAAFVVVTELIFGIPTHPARLSAPWFAGWFALASATLLLWLLAFAPAHFWLRLIRQERTSLLMGCLLGISAWMFIRIDAPLGQEEFWNDLAKPTMQLVHLMLGWFYSDLFYQPEKFLLGTASFHVEIFYPCSGLEGISLITIFLTIYLWLFRKELRFPQALWLFPLGIILIWLANAVRIALLIAIGSSFSPEIALEGFHKQAGWIAFTFIAIGAIAMSNRMQFFAVSKPVFPVFRTSKSLAAALLVPFLVLSAARMVTSASSSGFDLIYPLRVVVVVIMLCYFRKAYKNLGWNWTWHAPAIGTAVFMIWILLEPNVDSSKTALSQGLANLTTESAAIWLVFRVLGSVITVPLAEELAFRGYLLRKLIAKDFENLPLGQFSLFSLIFSSILFGLMHKYWLAGTLAGMGYALALYRRGQLGDAVIAHMTTNALIAIFVLTQARWSLWS
jgi:exosortase E/protease (VPEID-CTERM system)